MAKVKITLTKSLIGRKKNHILTANSLGLKKIGDVKVVEKDVAIAGAWYNAENLIAMLDSNLIYTDAPADADALRK